MFIIIIVVIAVVIFDINYSIFYVGVLYII